MNNRHGVDTTMKPASQIPQMKNTPVSFPGTKSPHPSSTTPSPAIFSVGGKTVNYVEKGFGKKNLVGVDIGSSSVKAVELQGKPGSLQLVSLGYENLQMDSIVDGQIMELNDVSNVITNIFREHQIKTDRIAAGVSGHSVIVKKSSCRR